MSGITYPFITDQDTRTIGANSSVDQYPWGQLFMTSDGRIFAYAANKSTSTALSPGKITQSNTSVTANHVNQTGVVLTAGTQQGVSYTIGNTAITADQYTYGFFVVNKNTGAGQTLTIGSHNTPSGNGTVKLNLIDAVITATDTTSKFSLYPNVFSSCVIWSSAATTGMHTGVPLISVTAATTALPFSTFFAQVGGPCAILADASTWVGQNDGIIGSALTNGAVGIEATSTITQRIGYAQDTLVSTEYRPVMLTTMVV